MINNNNNNNIIISSNEIELLNQDIGGKVIFSTDDFFANAENLNKLENPIWDEFKFTEFGKWMDGWETRRKRTLGHDWSIFQLGVPGTINRFEIDTAYFTGNQTPYISIQGANLLDNTSNEIKQCLKNAIRTGDQMGKEANQDQINNISILNSHQWPIILNKTKLNPGYQDTRFHKINVNFNDLNLDPTTIFTHIRVNYYPDGGVARLRVFGQVQGIKQNDLFDVASIIAGGKSIACSNAHYGSPNNLIAPGEAKNMAGGWETARNPNRPQIYELGNDGQIIIPGNEWSLLQLAGKSTIQKCILDTKHFKGNYPESALIEGIDISEELSKLSENKSLSTEIIYNLISKLPQSRWSIIVPRTKMKSNNRFEYNVENNNEKTYTHIKLTIYPDGGISRVLIYGKLQ